MLYNKTPNGCRTSGVSAKNIIAGKLDSTRPSSYSLHVGWKWDAGIWSSLHAVAPLMPKYQHRVSALCYQKRRSVRRAEEEQQIHSTASELTRGFLALLKFKRSRLCYTAGLEALQHTYKKATFWQLHTCVHSVKSGHRRREKRASIEKRPRRKMHRSRYQK